jgi:acyl-CoA synthetase (NDP forming)
MSFDPSPIQRLLDAAAAEDRFCLLEHEVYAVLDAAGCSVPKFALLAVDQPPTQQVLDNLGSDEIILKVVSPDIAHKTDVGGVVKVKATTEDVAAAMRLMLDTIPGRYVSWLEAHPGLTPEAFKKASPDEIQKSVRDSIRGFLVVEKIAMLQAGPGSEVLVGLRHNREFGPVLTLGIGGVDTELLGSACRKGTAVVTGSPDRLDASALLGLMRPTLAYQRLAGLTRGGQRAVEDSEIERVIEAFRRIAKGLGTDEREGDGWTVTELEVNPFAVAGGKLLALDGLMKFRRKSELPLARPHASIDALLHPSSIGLIGVSSKGMNMGRIILRNVLQVGFDPKRTYVVRPGLEELDGVRCVPSIEALPERVDVFVLAVNADQVPDVLEDLVKFDKAVGVILIAGGLGEKEGGESIELRVKNALLQARRSGKPLVINGGNSLGVVSRPGKYHTMFIPQNKLPLGTTGKGNVAFLSQSGAYMISRMSKMAWLSPRYATSTGNQTDLSVADYLSFLAADEALQSFAVYVEGFKDGDGLCFARAVEKATRAGKDVIFYKAGRTAEGKSATSGHTASLAGEYDVCEAIVREAGAHVAPTFADFLNLVKISSLLGQKSWKGPHLAAMSNAGYEAVGIADSVRGEGWDLTLAKLTNDTRGRLERALAAGKIDGLVDVRNPLDVTPMANDQTHEDVIRAFLDDPQVDMVLCASVPLTPAMATLAAGVPPEWTIDAPGSLPNRLGRIVEETDKPLIGCIDSGELFDPMVRMLEDRGVPTFRSADEAIRTMGLYLKGRLRRAAP